MIKTTVMVEGMACSMCEAHVNDSVREALQISKVTSSHKKGTTEILSEAPLDEQVLTAAITKHGYKVQGIHAEPYEKKGFSLFRRGGKE